MYLKIERPTVFISRTPSPPRLPRPRRINFRVRQRRHIPYICQCRINFRALQLLRCTQPFQPWQHRQRRHIPYICQCRVNFRALQLCRCTQAFQPWPHRQRRHIRRYHKNSHSTSAPLPLSPTLLRPSDFSIPSAPPISTISTFPHVPSSSYVSSIPLVPPNFSVPSVFPVFPDVTIPSSSFEEKSFLK